MDRYHDGSAAQKIKRLESILAATVLESSQGFVTRPWATADEQQRAATRAISQLKAQIATLKGEQK